MSRFLTALACAFLLAGCATETLVTVNSSESDAQSGDYQVRGAVIHPGTFHLPPREYLTLGEALGRSGGVKPGNEWDDGGNPDAVRVQRVVHGSVVEYTLRAEPGGNDVGFVVRPGDYIFVPKRTFSTPISNPLPYAN